MTGLGTAGAAAIGAGLAQWIGFKPTFLIVGILSLAGCGILFFLQAKEPKKAAIRIDALKKR